ncbi:hypothetical protein H6S82_07670 [Planktothrix sp. FACHB-1355]|uniref:Uncharacterized protein n=1 Tax=Aerosakkonema funiforme FACHB-1375 TaxID=2949571 RepID=A0A926VKY3_9CYAN|nr:MULTISPECIES: hypothetical protein [Oscillatoriales]MBD2185608.1 hypothetical protein [Aerosakkonema funiforme FACHB-1375]MBD3558733.1 hypothetical protein [Planktothrix sp. FACHB-1355]
MAEKVNPKPNEAPTHDAQLAAENIVAGAEKAPEVDVNADYEASKAFSVSEIDRTGAGTQAAAAATAPQFEVRQPQETTFKAEPTDNPDDYIDMARDVNPASEGVGNVSDDLVKKALEKGKAAQ